MCPYAIVAKLMKFRNQRSIRPKLEIKNVTPIMKQADCCQDIVTIHIYFYKHTQFYVQRALAQAKKTPTKQTQKTQKINNKTYNINRHKG